MSENDLLKTIESFAVKSENILVNRNTLTDMKQNSDEEAIHYAARLKGQSKSCLLYTSPSPRDKRQSRMPSSA